MDISAEAVTKADWPARADEVQRSLKKHFYNEKTGIMNQWFPREYFRPDDNFYYWWHAHVLDVLIDAYERTHDPELALQIREYSRSLRTYNGGTFLHNYYDDMEWTALALLRAFQATGEEEYKTAVLELWTDIQTAWNDHFGGGMTWKKDQLETFRYSGGAGNAGRYLYVNGAGVVNNVVFNGTGIWDSYNTVTIPNVTLNSGSNTISLIYDTGKGSTNYLNLDHLKVSH